MKTERKEQTPIEPPYIPAEGTWTSSRNPRRRRGRSRGCLLLVAISAPAVSIVVELWPLLSAASSYLTAHSIRFLASGGQQLN
jgi:hypothetical protein